MRTCLLCRNPLDVFIEFGRMPVANGFLGPREFAGEPFFNLSTGLCPACLMVQLGEVVPAEQLFHDNYAFFSSSSVRMEEHFERFAAVVKARHLAAPDPFVVEIGSNDGILLRHFGAAGIRHLGVEPSSNVARVATSLGVKTIVCFFNETIAEEIRSEYGPADVLLGANVFCHLPEIESAVRGARILLKDDGVLVIEDPTLLEILERVSYDQIYDEHVFYFSLLALERLFDRHGMEVVNAEPQEVHGGSMRYTVAQRGVHPVSASVGALRDREHSARLDRTETLHAFRGRVERSRDGLVALLRKLKSQGNRIAAYGATSKSTTVTNYCGIGPDLIEYVSDTTPGKQGLFTPGAHIPVVSHEKFSQEPPDYALLFAWNHAAEIIAKEDGFIAKGGRFILYVPNVHTMP